MVLSEQLFIKGESYILSYSFLTTAMNYSFDATDDVIFQKNSNTRGINTTISTGFDSAEDDILVIFYTKDSAKSAGY